MKAAPRPIRTYHEAWMVLRRYEAQDLTTRPTLRALARASGVRYGTFLTWFARAGLHRPARVLASLRLARALACAAQGVAMPSYCYQLGYSSPSAMARASLALTGRTPRQWREAA